MALVVYGIVLYNQLVGVKNRVFEATANIDALLKQRQDELPKLVETCKQYMDYELPALKAITEMRGEVFKALESVENNESGAIDKLGKAEGRLRSGLGRLFALAENYPDLKANASFLQLQSRISGLETSIAERRELYNNAVNLNNIKREQFPEMIIAGLFSFKGYELLEFTEAETADVNIGELFNS